MAIPDGQARDAVAAGAAPIPDVAGDPDARISFVRMLIRDEASHSAGMIETHMSWVFLTDRHAYKLKKPVRYDYLDFSTIEARRQNCEDEIRLNRRLAPDVYLAAIPLTADAEGGLRLDGTGAVVDWLVKMRRLPADQMMDRAITARTLTRADVRHVAGFLSHFYLGCAPIELDPARYRECRARDIGDNLRELTDPAFALAADPIRAVCAAQRAFLEQRAELFDRRVRAGHIVEGHGDLRPEHICLRPVLAIIDCLEFSRELRILDAADELAYLALECERLGAAWAGGALFEAYTHVTGDAPDPALIHFHQSFRACLRAKIALWHLKEVRFRSSPKWKQLALEYLHLAGAHASRLAGTAAPTPAAGPRSNRRHESA